MYQVGEIIRNCFFAESAMEEPDFRTQIGLPLSRIGSGAERHRVFSVGSKLKCPVFVASEMSGFKVVPSPFGWG